MSKAPPVANAAIPEPTLWSKKMIIILVAVSLLVAGLVGGGMWYFMNSSSKEETVALNVFDEVIVETKYHTFEEPFVVNIPSGKPGKMAYLQTTVSLAVNSEEGLERITANAPLIQNSILLAFSGATLEELKSKDSIVDFEVKILKSINKTMEEKFINLHVKAKENIKNGFDFSKAVYSSPNDTTEEEKTTKEDNTEEQNELKETTENNENKTATLEDEEIIWVKNVYFQSFVIQE